MSDIVVDERTVSQGVSHVQHLFLCIVQNSDEFSEVLFCQIKLLKNNVMRFSWIDSVCQKSLLLPEPLALLAAIVCFPIVLDCLLFVCVGESYNYTI